MDYNQLLNQLNQAGLFELYRLKTAIDYELDNPERLTAFKQKLRLGMTLSYFEPKENRLIEGKLLEMRPKKAVILDYERNSRLALPYYMLNVEGGETAIHQKGKQLTANELKVGDIVGFNKDGRDIAGVIKRLNSKTVTLAASDGNGWRVPYAYLYRIHDAELVKEQLLQVE